MTHLIVHEHELTLKGGNRGWFEDRLIDAARTVFDGLIEHDVLRAGGRLIIKVSQEVDPDELQRRSRRLFGAAFVVLAQEVSRDFDVILNEVKNIRVDGAKTFRIRTQRADKSFPLTSQEVNERIGAAVQEATGWSVNLDEPDVTIYIEILRDRAFVGIHRFDAPGGLPIGSSGRFMVMLSGGIDSPVAAYEIMKRGGSCDFIHFHSVPFTSRASVEKV